MSVLPRILEMLDPRSPAYTPKAVRLKRDIEAIAASPQGRRFLVWLRDATGHLEPTFHENPQIAAYKEGRRSVYTDIAGLINVKLKEDIEGAFHDE